MEFGKREVRIVTTVEDFVGLGPAWEALVTRSSADSPFLSHEWFDAAWQWRQATAALYVLCLFRNDTLVAVLPLVVARRGWAGTVIRELTFLTVPDTQLCDVIVAQQDRADAAEAFARALIALQSDWDVMRLEHLNSDSFAGMDLRVALAKQGLRGQVVAAGENPYLFLDTTWDAYHQTRSRRFKKANNLVANRLQRMGAVTIDWLAPGTGNAADVARAIEVIRGVSARSWKVATGNSLDHPGPGAFIRRLSELAHRRGWLSVWTLSLDGVPIAMEYQLVANGCVFALRSDFDATIEEQASPGSYLSRQLTERLFGGGLRRYFMGPGKNPYKYRWSQAADPRFAMTVYGRTLRGRTLRAWEGSLKPAARALRDRIGRKSATLPAEQSDGADVSSDQGH